MVFFTGEKETTPNYILDLASSYPRLISYYDDGREVDYQLSAGKVRGLLFIGVLLIGAVIGFKAFNQVVDASNKLHEKLINIGG